MDEELLAEDVRERVQAAAERRGVTASELVATALDSIEAGTRRPLHARIVIRGVQLALVLSIVVLGVVLWWQVAPTGAHSRVLAHPGDRGILAGTLDVGNIGGKGGYFTLKTRVDADGIPVTEECTVRMSQDTLVTLDRPPARVPLRFLPRIPGYAALAWPRYLDDGDVPVEVVAEVRGRDIWAIAVRRIPKAPKPAKAAAWLHRDPDGLYRMTAVSHGSSGDQDGMTMEFTDVQPADPGRQHRTVHALVKGSVVLKLPGKTPETIALCSPFDDLDRRLRDVQNGPIPMEMFHVELRSEGEQLRLVSIEPVPGMGPPDNTEDLEDSVD